MLMYFDKHVCLQYSPVQPQLIRGKVPATSATSANRAGNKKSSISSFVDITTKCSAETLTRCQMLAIDQ